MPKFEVWKISTIKERVIVDAPTIDEALEDVVENSNDYDFEFVDADSTYDAYPEENK